MNESENKAWYLVHAKPREEQIALMNLERQEYECYLPMTLIRRRKKMNVLLQKEPLFPRYLFVHLEVGVHDFSPIRSTRGVSKLVRFGGMPAKIPDQLIAIIRGKEIERCENASLNVEMQKGDRVRIMDGVMAGYEGIFEAKSGAERARVLLEMVDKYTHVHLDTVHLEKLDN